MNRGYGKQADRKRRRDTKRAGKHVSLWVPPAKADCDSYEPTSIPISETTRIVTVLSYKDNRLAYFAMMHEILEGRNWIQVTRIDCSHGTVHQHFHGRYGGENIARDEITNLYSIDDVSDAWDTAYGLIADNLDQNERKWRNG